MEVKTFKLNIIYCLLTIGSFGMVLPIAYFEIYRRLRFVISNLMLNSFFTTLLIVSLLIFVPVFVYYILTNKSRKIVSIKLVDGILLFFNIENRIKIRCNFKSILKIDIKEKSISTQKYSNDMWKFEYIIQVKTNTFLDDLKIINPDDDILKIFQKYATELNGNKPILKSSSG